MIDVSGKTVVLTGTFVGVTRAVAEAGLIARGAKVSGAVSKKTDVVFAGQDAGSKLEKARALGVVVAGESELLAILTGAAPASSVAPHPFHAAFDRLVDALRAHPRVHVALLHRGPPRPLDSITAPFVARFGIAPGDDVRSFYTTRDGCALMWLDREDPDFDPVRHRPNDAPGSYRAVEERMTDTTHVIAMPPLDHVLGPDGMDYACENVVIGAARERYDRSFIAFDFPGDYYTPAFVVERGRIAVQVGDDHGVFDDGRPTVPLDVYLDGVIATKGSIPWRNDLFGLGMQPRRSFDPAHPPSIDDLLPPSRQASAEASARAEAIESAQPTDPRLRALVEAALTARSLVLEPQKDGRTLARLEREDGSRQLTFLKPDERDAFERGLAARRS
jgi:hypothetical protein